MHYSKLSENITVHFSTCIHNTHLYIVAKHTENEQYKKDNNRRKRRQVEQECERREGPRKKQKCTFQEVGEESARYRAQER